MNTIVTHLIGGICIGLGAFLWGWIARGWYSRRIVRKWLAQSQDGAVISGGGTYVNAPAPKPAPPFCAEDA